MVQVLFLMVWMVSGLAAAAALPQPGEPRLAWAPLALMLGPLWIAVAFEQRGWAERVVTTSTSTRVGRSTEEGHWTEVVL